MNLRPILTQPDGPQKTAALVAWVQALYKGRTSKPVLVGGAAVELLTGGAYTTGDLDFAGHVPKAVQSAFVAAGFRKKGRHWIHAEGQVFLEFPAEELEADEESVDLDIAGWRLRVLAPEAILVDRLAAWELWSSSTDAVNAFLVLRAVGDRLDWSMIEALARKRQVGQALDRLRAFTRRFPDSDPTDEELVKWAETDGSS